MICQSILSDKVAIVIQHAMYATYRYALQQSEGRQCQNPRPEGLGQNLAYATAYAMAYSVAYLLFCKDTFITLAFEGIRTLYLVHIGLLAMAIYGITHHYRNLVTMATEACVCNFAV